MYQTCADFKSFDKQDNLESMFDNIECPGIVASRWHLYQDRLAPIGEILIGVMPESSETNCFTRVLVKSFLN